MDLEDAASDPAPRSAAGRVAAWFQASPVEVAGLAILLLGAVLVTGLVVLDIGRRPGALPPAAEVGRPATSDDLLDPGPAQGHVPSDHEGPPGQRPASAEAANDEVVVHVSGAVRDGGVVTLVPGARVAEAITAAGGVTADADPDRLNLARVLVDGEQVYVPREGEPAPEGASPPTGGIAGDGRVDLNRATQEELETLPGIGPAKASAIVEHRESFGSFTVPGDLRAVPGIGERTFQQLADLITVG